MRAALTSRWTLAARAHDDHALPGTQRDTVDSNGHLHVDVYHFDEGVRFEVRENVRGEFANCVRRTISQTGDAAIEEVRALPARLAAALAPSHRHRVALPAPAPV